MERCPHEDGHCFGSITQHAQAIFVYYTKCFSRNEVGGTFCSIVYLSNSLESRVNGAQLSCMLETYVKAVNDPNAIPVVETSWQTSLRIIAERVHNEALEIYKKGMTAALEERAEEPLEAGGREK